MIYLIYKATNLINGKCYVGQTTRSLDKRIKEHSITTNKKPFQRALKKYGIENFIWEMLCECEDKLILNLRETMKIIVEHSHVSEGGYNLTWGGDGGNTWESNQHKEETSLKLSKIRKGKKHTTEAKRKNSESHKGKTSGMLGKHHSQKTRDKISKNHANISGENNPNYGNTGEKCYCWGMKHSSETKNKMRIAALKREERRRNNGNNS